MSNEAVSDQSIEAETKDKQFGRRLTALDMTLRQKEFIMCLKRARQGDDWEIIGSWMNPPMSGGAARNMMYRLREDYRAKKRYTNLYEAVMRSMGKKDFDVL